MTTELAKVEPELKVTSFKPLTRVLARLRERSYRFTTVLRRPTSPFLSEDIIDTDRFTSPWGSRRIEEITCQSLHTFYSYDHSLSVYLSLNLFYSEHLFPLSTKAKQTVGKNHKKPY